MTTTSTVYILESNGEVRELVYSLPPQEAIKACVIQEVMNIRSFVGKDIEVPIKQSRFGYMYESGDNSAVWVRK